MIANYIWKSALGNLMSDFLKEKRALGYVYNTEKQNLSELDRHLFNLGFKEKRLDKEVILAWLEKRPNEKNSSRSRRMSTINEFARYMQRNRYDAYIIPFKYYPQCIRDFKARIFTESEIKNLLYAADNYPIDKVYPLRHHKISLLFLILINSGLRVSEATNLKVKNVDLENGILTILQAKNKTDRLIPLSEFLTQRCCKYAELCLEESSSEDYFFPGNRVKYLREAVVYAYFRKLLWRCGISHLGRGKGPRLHDLRHTFAVHCLNNWVRNGTSLSAALPVLSKYMGHISLVGTQKYLQLTVEMYPDITQKLEEEFGFLIPENGDNNENN